MTAAALAEAVMLSFGWRRRLIALAAGASGALTLAPFGLWPLLVVPMGVALWLIDGVAGLNWRARAAHAFVDGWFWGFGYFVAGLWWLGAAFLVEADRFAWAMPLGVIGLPMVLALFPAAGFALAKLIWSQGLLRLFALGAGLTASEMARATLFTGFPWNAYGQALAENLWIAQMAAHVGLHGLTLLAVILGAAPAALARAVPGPKRRLVGALAAGTLAALLAHGWWRIPAAPPAMMAGVKLRIMQPNLPQDDKFRPERARDILERYLALSDSATSPGTSGLADVTHLVWPESAFPFLLARTPAALARIGQALPDHVTLITGAARAGAELPGEGRPPIYNSIHVLNGRGEILGSADKTHLVPFGEYLPSLFDDALRAVGLKEFVAIPGGFSAGRERRALLIPGIGEVAPLICYEAIFPGTVSPDQTRARPVALLNVTNDAWFGATPGPHQHLAQARLRAVEEGLPLIRAANNGISAIVDGYGRRVADLPHGQDGVLDAGLPIAIKPTTYSRIGNILALVLVLASAGTGAAARLRRKD
jgi:apolipoprotein N-acyltransferase